MAAKTSQGKPWRKPKALSPMDSVAVIAPSGPVPSSRLTNGLSVLSARYRVVQSAGLLEQRGFLAGEDGRRLAELRWALSDPQIHAVFCARGGHGALRLLSPLLATSSEELPHPPLVGVSDGSVLQALLASGDTVYLYLAVFAVMMSLIGAFYYLRLVKVMYFDAPITASNVVAGADVRVVLSRNGAVIILLGLLPGGLMALCAQSVVQIVGT